MAKKVSATVLGARLQDRITRLTAERERVQDQMATAESALGDRLTALAALRGRAQSGRLTLDDLALLVSEGLLDDPA